MEVSTRRGDGVLLVSLAGDWPEDERAEVELANDLRVAVGDADRFVLDLDHVRFTRSIDFGVLLAVLRRAEIPMGVLGSGPFIHAVTSDEGVRNLMSVVDSPFRVFDSETEAFAAVRQRSWGCFSAWVLSSFIALLAVLVSLAAAYAAK